MRDPLEAALRIYTDIPLEEGDAILLLDNMVCLEMEGLASHWDATMSQTRPASCGRPRAR